MINISRSGRGEGRGEVEGRVEGGSGGEGGGGGRLLTFMVDNYWQDVTFPFGKPFVKQTTYNIKVMRTP